MPYRCLFVLVTQLTSLDVPFLVSKLMIEQIINIKFYCVIASGNLCLEQGYVLNNWSMG